MGRSSRIGSVSELGYMSQSEHVVWRMHEIIATSPSTLLHAFQSQVPPALVDNTSYTPPDIAASINHARRWVRRSAIFVGA